MQIGPVDIRNQSFRKKTRGFDAAEVRAYLDVIADRMEALVTEKRSVEEKTARLEQELASYRGLDERLRDSLISAGKISEERIATAEKEAKLVRENAGIEAEKIVARAHSEAARLRGELDDLKRQRVSFIERFRALLRSQKQILEVSVDDFADSPRSAPPSPSASSTAEEAGFEQEVAATVRESSEGSAPPGEGVSSAGSST
ncbi:MAG: DivIVA domain-containing protein [Gemmatimonadota bacterium]|jgi:cell division initiation protein|nr:cell division protein DivIVA [Gemmatimonadota bacterium]MDP6529559.1 DivIVA domain-containing protein [Gemmatimonadota bacterium]MDP6803541.1 DivIVA domain-containing protein [Gemmatimonadota bacterium]MDP7031917.1 DivIVA domain-containing protein [Gemmatimonadota bacterium]